MIIAAIAALLLQAQPTAVRGVVFLDRNANGTREATERGLAGVAVSNQDTVVLTDASGGYALPSTGLGAVFVSVPRGHRAVGGWWKAAVSRESIDFALSAAAEPVPYRFVQASDTHIAPAVVARTRRMIALVDSIKPAMLLITGDLVKDALRVSETEAMGYYTLFANELRTLRTPFYTVPGNHEIFGIERAQSKVAPDHPLLGKAMYRQQRGPDYYSFNAAGVHFVALNTVDVDDQWYYGHVDSLQLAWLRRDLAVLPAGTPIVTFSHIPLASASETLGGYTEAPPAPTLITVAGRKQFRHVTSNLDDVLAALGAHPLAIALAGHIHYRETLTLETARGRLRFFQSAAIVGDTPKGRQLLPSGLTVYTIRNGEVDDGRFLPLGPITP